ncbi:MAG: non-canonical purine NTP pyrophosphatase [Candidatus Moranbacteria bacterium]|nr:non-canonical purine NTP pyrophosphatase [Candidatus Moranbacteria bacterium]
MDSITFITGNPGKVNEVRRYLDYDIDHIPLDLPEIQSLSSRDIVEDKAWRAYREIGRPVLVEDVSFVVHSLGGLPGPLIKWFEKAIGLEGLCRMADGKDRSCTASILYGYCDGKRVLFAEGEMRGIVADMPRGENSFGWAPIFIGESMDRTYAELSIEEQEIISYRKKALEKMKRLLLTR